MFWEKDLPFFFNEFAVDITLDNGTIFKALFDDVSDFSDKSEYTIAIDKPVLTVSITDTKLLNLKKKDVLYINNNKYSIFSVKNGIGTSIIELFEED